MEAGTSGTVGCNLVGGALPGGPPGARVGGDKLGAGSLEGPEQEAVASPGGPAGLLGHFEGKAGAVQGEPAAVGPAKVRGAGLPGASEGLEGDIAK